MYAIEMGIKSNEMEKLQAGKNENVAIVVEWTIF